MTHIDLSIWREIIRHRFQQMYRDKLQITNHIISFLPFFILCPNLLIGNFIGSAPYFQVHGLFYQLVSELGMGNVDLCHSVINLKIPL